MEKKQYIIFAIVLVLAGGAYFMFHGRSLPEGTTRVIERRDDGFYPADLSIREGDTVEFKNISKNYFWPASDLHPTHGIYSEFDPKEPIGVNESWSFTFKKTGAWKYHDHLAPYFTGTITVTGSEKVSAADPCRDTPKSYLCFQEQIVGTLKVKGVNAAFDRLETLYESEPDFPGICHFIAHNMGIPAYALYLKDKDSILTPKASYCANGFYHGFMEALLTSTRSVDDARAFCDYVGEKLGNEAPDAKLQCFHGIGHGAIDLASEVGNATEDQILKPALGLCETAARTKEELYRCASGVFNGIANFYIDSEHGFEINKDDPIWICRNQEEKYKESCYGNMNSLLFWISKNDFDAALPLVSTIEKAYAPSAIRYFASLSALYIARKNPEAAIFGCRKAEPDLRTPCIEGFAHGLLEHGKPGKEYEEALAFCAVPSMTSAEHETCMEYVLSNLHGWYSLTKSREICSTINHAYQKYCSTL